MAKKYILIDYENVKAVDLEPIFDKPYHLLVFVGASQHRISTDFAMQVQNLRAAEYVRISGNGHNALDFHIAYMIGHARNNNYHCLEASTQAEEAWLQTIKAMSMFNAQFLKECTPGYYNNEGHVDEGNSLLGSQYGGGPEAFFQLIKEWREEGSLEGLSFS